MKCSICMNVIDKQYTPDGKMYWDQGHNAHPIGNPGDRCCSDCNNGLVLPARIKAYFTKKLEERKMPQPSHLIDGHTDVADHLYDHSTKEPTE